jgi:hypothetical protein
MANSTRSTGASILASTTISTINYRDQICGDYPVGGAAGKSEGWALLGSAVITGVAVGVEDGSARIKVGSSTLIVDIRGQPPQKTKADLAAAGAVVVAPASPTTFEAPIKGARPASGVPAPVLSTPDAENTVPRPTPSDLVTEVVVDVFTTQTSVPAMLTRTDYFTQTLSLVETRTTTGEDGRTGTTLATVTREIVFATTREYYAGWMRTTGVEFTLTATRVRQLQPEDSTRTPVEVRPGITVFRVTQTLLYDPSNTHRPNAGDDDDDGGNTDSKNEIVISVTTTKADYFVASILPTLLAVLFAIPWKAISTDIESMEPFYQLTRPGGCPPSASLFAGYTRSQSLALSVFALRRRHFAIATASLLEYLSCLVAPLAAEAVRMGLLGSCAEKRAEGCASVAQVRRPAVRALEAVLATMSILAAVLILLLTSRRSYGVASNPRTFGAIAALPSEETMHFLARIGQLRPMTREQFRASEKQRRKMSWFMLHLRQDLASGEGQLLVCNFARTINKVDGQSMALPIGSSPVLRLFPLLALFTAYIAGLFTLVLVYGLTSGDTGFERFVSGQSFGVKFFFTMLGVLVGFGWTGIFKGK